LPRARTIQRFRDDRADVEAKVVDAIQRVGPRNVSLLSRMTGAHAETIRYKVKKRFRKLGFRLFPAVDYEKLGLTVATGELRFTEQAARRAEDVLKEMSRSAYLTYYAKIIPQGHYMAAFAIPRGRSSDYVEFLSFLKEEGILREFRFEEVTARRTATMNPRFFNFQSGLWDVDWTAVKSSPGTRFGPDATHQKAAVDRYDLLLVKEFQVDAFQHVVGIARKLKVHQKTLEYHYRAHVQGRTLIPLHAIHWMHEGDRPLSWSVILTHLTFRGLGAEYPKVQRAVSKIPFLWFEYLHKDGSYSAVLCTPVKEAVGTLDYLASELPGLFDRVTVGYVGRGSFELFTVPFSLFDGEWAFDAKVLRKKYSSFAVRGRRK
jgi:DNA-binding Lrp family transcriptional regulator